MKMNLDRQDTTPDTPHPDDDDMPAEIDFSGGTRGKFHRPAARLNLPVYLEAEVQAYLATIAAKKGVPLSEPQTTSSEGDRHPRNHKVERPRPGSGPFLAARPGSTLFPQRLNSRRGEGREHAIGKPGEVILVGRQRPDQFHALPVRLGQ